MLNQLHRNVVWGQRGNFVDVPTDCPQRDERLGWTGDLAVFAPTAVFLFDSSGFLRDWLRDLDAEQRAADGMVPFVVPDVIKFMPPNPSSVARTRPRSGATPPSGCRGRPGRPTAIGWRWPRPSRPWPPRPPGGGPALGEWAVGQGLPVRRTGLTRPPRRTTRPRRRRTRAWCRRPRSTAVARRVAAIARDARAGRRGRPLRGAGGAAATAFNEHYVTDEGRVLSDCPTVYALAIAFGLLDEPQRAVRRRSARRTRRRERLPDRDRVRRNAVHLRCAHPDRAPRPRLPAAAGAGVPVLAVSGHMGATTIWERWDSMLPDGIDQPGRDDQLQPLRPRCGGGLDASRRRRPRAGRPRVSAGPDRPAARWRSHLGEDLAADTARQGRRGWDRRRGSRSTSTSKGSRPISAPGRVTARSSAPCRAQESRNPSAGWRESEPAIEPWSTTRSWQ